MLLADELSRNYNVAETSDMKFVNDEYIFELFETF